MRCPFSTCQQVVFSGRPRNRRVISSKARCLRDSLRPVFAPLFVGGLRVVEFVKNNSFQFVHSLLLFVSLRKVCFCVPR